MKKIFDWTVGSFFRTIGRAIAFFVMAMLVYCLLSYNDIDFGLKNLFFDNVKADELDSNAWVSFYTDEQKTNALPAQGYYQYYTLNNNTNQNTVSIFMSQNFTRNNNFDYISIPYLLLGNTTTTGTYTTRRYECSWREVYDNGNYYYVPNTCGYDTSAGGNYDTQNIPIESDLRLSIVLTDGLYNAPCKIEKDSITCQLQKNINYHILVITYISNGLNNSTGLKLGFNYVVGMYKNSQNAIVEQQQQTNEAITNQTQQQQQQHQETMNSSTTDAENDASSFFGNFTVEDQGGLSAIVTAPLNTIRSLLSSTCADLVLPLPFVEEDLTLPCMYSIYSQHFGAFFSLYQTIILGIIAYRCIMSIFFDIKGFTNPNDDRIEVMDL